MKCPLNTVHILSLLAKRNNSVLTDNALIAVTHFFLCSTVNTGNTKSVKSSTCVNLYSTEDYKTCIHANLVSIRSMFFSSSESMPLCQPL